MELKEGPLDQFTHEMEPFLRKQGMPVRLNKGLSNSIPSYKTHTHTHNKIRASLMNTYKFFFFEILTGIVELVGDFAVCEEGKPISPESSRILVCSHPFFIK